MYLTELAGLLKIHEVLPQIVDYLADEESGDYLWDSAVEAIGLIGDPLAAALIEARFAENDYTFRIFACAALGKLKHPGAIQALHALKRVFPPDTENHTYLFRAMCEQLVPESLTWARELFSSRHSTPDDHYMKRHLIATARLHGLDLPEAESWREEIEEEEREMERRLDKPFAVGEPTEPNQPIQDNRTKVYLDQAEEIRRFEPVRREPKVGRNDPCPCGSGKKFKKCCLNKPK